MTDQVTARLADALRALCNASPRTPSREDFIECIEEVALAEGGITIPQGTEVMPAPGNSLRVNEHGGLEVRQWSFRAPRKLTPQQEVLAILEFLRHGVLTAPRLN